MKTPTRIPMFPHSLRGTLTRTAFAIGCLAFQGADAAQIAGNLLVELNASDFTNGNPWPQSTANGVPVIAGDFAPTGTPKRETISGATAVVLDGYGEYFTGPVTTSALHGPLATHSVEYWVYQGNADIEEAVVSWGHRGGSPDGSMAGFRYSNHVAWGAVARWGSPDMGFAPVNTGTPVTGTWHHIVVTYDGGTQRIYVDGVLNATEAALLDAKDSRPILVGAEWENTTTVAGDGLKYSGAIGKIRIHSGVLSASQIADNHALERPLYRNKQPQRLTAAPVNRYSFNDPAAGAPDSTQITDSVGGQHGSVKGAGAAFTGTGIDLTGGSSATESYLDFPNNLISTKTSVTIEFWATQQSVNNWNRLLDIGTTTIGEVTGPGGAFNGSNYLALTANNGTGATVRLERAGGASTNGGNFRDSQGTDQDPGADLPVTTVGTRYHYVVVYDQTSQEWRWYRDGKMMEVLPDLNGLSALPDVNVWFGRSNFAGDANYNGVFDEIRIYDYALSEGQVYGNFLEGPDRVVTGFQWTPVAGGTFDFNNAAGADNWATGTGGPFPNSAGAAAAINTNFTGDQTINLNVPVTLGDLILGDADGSNAVVLAANGGSLTFDNGGAQAHLHVTGSNQNNVISAPLTLAGDTLIQSFNPGNLTITSAISGPGNLTVGAFGGGTLSIGNGGTGGSLGSGNVTLDAGAVLVLNRSDAVSLTQTISGGGTLNIAGAGTVTNTGSLTHTGRINVADGASFTNEAAINGPGAIVSDGDLTLKGSSQTTLNGFMSVGTVNGGQLALQDTAALTVNGGGDFNIGDVGTGNSSFLMSGGSASVGTIWLGKFNNTSGVLVQSGGGFIERAGGGDNRLGGGDAAASNGFGAWRVNGGTVETNGNFQIGAYGTGIMTVDGGAVNFATAWPVVGRFQNAGVRSYGLLDVISGSVAQSSVGNRLIIGESGYGTLNVRGSGLVDLTGGLVIGHDNGGPGDGTVNLLAGGIIATPLVTQFNFATGLGTLNFNGGILRAKADNPNFITDIDRSFVHAGGAVFDTNGFSVATFQLLENPSGDGVATIPVVNGGSGYLAAPFIEITGGGGSGATAVANLTGDVVTSITVTNPGIDYTSAPTIVIRGGGAGSGLAVGTPTLATNSGGGVTKTGAGTLSLSGFNNYSGPTLVQQGTLLVGDSSAAVGTVTVNSGAVLGGTFGNLGGTLVVNGSVDPGDGAITGELVAGAGATFNAGSQLVINIDESQTPVNDKLTVTGNVTIAAGATVAASIVGSATQLPYTILEATGTITGDFPNPPGVTLQKVGGNVIQITSIISSTPFQDWINGFTAVPLDEREPGDDWDGDGAVNSVEFALNGDPTTGANNGLYAQLAQDTAAPAGNEMTLVVAVRDGATFTPGSVGSRTTTAPVDGFDYAIEGSTDLVFPGGNVSHVTVSDTAPAATGLPDLTGTDWEYHTFRLEGTEGLPGKGFLRVSITP